jgi:hypothetical protein
MANAEKIWDKIGVAVMFLIANHLQYNKRQNGRKLLFWTVDFSEKQRRRPACATLSYVAERPHSGSRAGL